MRVGPGQLGRGQGRILGRIGGQQGQVATGRPAGQHDPVGPDLEVGGVVLHPGHRPLGIGDHPGQVGLGNSR